MSSEPDDPQRPDKPADKPSGKPADKRPGLRRRLSDDLNAPAPSAAPPLRFVLIVCGIAIAIAAIMLFVID